MTRKLATWSALAAIALLALIVLLVGRNATANHQPMDGQSFTFLQSGFTQDLYGIHPHPFGGVAFAPDGDPLVNDCGLREEGHRFDRQGVAPAPLPDPT